MIQAPLRLMRDVWREVSRHLEIGESVDALFPLIAAEIPVDWCLVRAVALDGSRLDTVGVGRVSAGEPPTGRTEVDPGCGRG